MPNGARLLFSRDHVPQRSILTSENKISESALEAGRRATHVLQAPVAVRFSNHARRPPAIMPWPRGAYVCRNFLAHASGLSRPGASRLAQASWRCHALAQSRPRQQYTTSSSGLFTDTPSILSIRERLRLWQVKEGEEPQDMISDAPLPGDTANSLSRTQATGAATHDSLGVDDFSTANRSAGQDPETVTSATHVRRPGDLVEMRQSGSRIPVCAIFLGRFGDRYHYYNALGKWIYSMGSSSVFTISHFASPVDLEPVLAKLPQKATPEQFDELRRTDSGPTREDGTGLIKKMAALLAETESIYQTHLSRFETAQSRLQHPTEFRHLSLVEIADLILPKYMRGPDGFSYSALYAIQKALSLQEDSFKPYNTSGDCQRPDHMYEVLPRSYSVVMRNVATMVHEYTLATSRRTEPIRWGDTKGVALGPFITEARQAVLRSREERQWSSYGILQPSSGVELPGTCWTQSSRDVLAFLEYWASYDLFDSGSSFHAYGSIILRALRLYDDALLDRSMAWTFLQEAGVITPWELPSRYKCRLPGVEITKGGGLSRTLPIDVQASMRKDIAVDARKQREEAETIFCIDDPSTALIDDGLSLERTDSPDEFWIHVHAADPASAIRPNSELSAFMELIPENVYLPGHFQAMIPSDLGVNPREPATFGGLVNKFSLRSGSRALTFSALVNKAGDILKHKIEPSRLGKVLYMTPEDVSEFCNEPRPPQTGNTTSISAGLRPDQEPAAPERPMVEAKDLDQRSKESLLMLYQLAEALRQKRLSKGAWPHFFPKPSIAVYFASESEEKASNQMTTIPGDPYVEVGKEASTGCSVISNSMVLAGEIAARWCSSRGIPIPFRRDNKLGRHHEAALAYAQNELYPCIAKGIEPRPSQWQELARHTGEVQMAAEAGPYFLLGLDMYTKVTSPLRRYCDMLVHWQIHAVLAHERKVGRPVNASTDKLECILPFTAQQLKLPLLRMRERIARAMSRGSADWILIALARRWGFEGRRLPALRFTVSSRLGQSLLGRLDLFDLVAVMDVAGLDGCRLLKDVRVGDEFEVELVHVNIHARRILVRATHYLGQGTAGLDDVGVGNAVGFRSRRRLDNSTAAEPVPA